MQRMLTRFTTFSILVLLLFASRNQASATHFMGIDIQVNCVNACTVEVEWRVYRDCTGSSFFSPSPLTWTPTVTGCNAPNPLGNWSIQTQVEVTPICPSIATACTNPSSTINGVQEFYQSRQYDICTGINANCEWDISWESCCRNGIITSGAASQSHGVINHYSIAQGCNNSPVYMNNPLFYACANTASSIFMGGIDPDGDSLSYSLASCLSTGTTPVTYNAGYSPTSPLGSSWNVTVDPTSGVLNLSPATGNIVVGVICITTTEWRNGSIVGTNTRDIQVAILACPANTPATLGPITNLSTGATLSSPNTITVCAGTSLCFDLEGFDPDTISGQTVSLLWDQSIPTATFTQTGNPAVTDTITGNSPNATFCWSNPVAGTYPLVVGLRDNACPIFGYTDQTIFIEVLGSSFGVTALSTSPTVNTCNGNPVTLSVAGGPYNSYLWATGATTPTIQVSTPGVYGVTVTAGTCNATGTGSVTINSANIPTVSGTVTLSNGTTPLENAPVYLITHDSTLNALAAIDTATTDSNGYYEFCGIPADTFYLKAAPQLPAYPNHLPTYADTAIYFNGAAFFETNNSPQTVDWSVKPGSNPGGSGFLGGLISQGANKRQGVGDPMPDVPVYLYSTSLGQFIGHTITDVNGYFSFPSIPLGDYEVSVDAPGVDEINVPMVTLSSQIPNQDSLDFRLHSTYLELVIPTSITTLTGLGNYFQVYPNPSSQVQTLKVHLDNASEVEISLYDIMGRKTSIVPSSQFDKGDKAISLENLPVGAYFLKVRLGNEIKIQKIVRW